MFCSNCGVEIKIPNQRYCYNCGTALTIISETPQLRTERTQYRSHTISQKIPGYTYIPVSKPLPDDPYRNSRYCLGFALVSIALVILGIIISGPIIIFRLYIVGFIICLAINVVGLIFGILSKLKSIKADKMEPDNAVQQVGNVFGIIGIIINVIVIVVILLVFPFLLLRT
ncbi:MAG: zinc ribbon domain-containing protein [Promethearchaeota archaeon]